jgi:hypothetical protein
VLVGARTWLSVRLSLEGLSPIWVETYYRSPKVAGDTTVHVHAPPMRVRVHALVSVRLASDGFSPKLVKPCYGSPQFKCKHHIYR